jgi:hypothetical protein
MLFEKLVPYIYYKKRETFFVRTLFLLFLISKYIIEDEV